ncbi:MAG: hypothetical protein ABSH50_12150 [Bryobacteraceae bacterium]|jgi:hypothetical protein
MTEPMPAPEATSHRWYHKVSALIFIVFCLELGMFLVIFPWSEFWDRSWFSQLAPEWHSYWLNAYLRGAVSGLGIVNVYIALVEIFRLRRFSRH